MFPWKTRDVAMENGRFLKFDLYTLRRVLIEQNWLPIKKNVFKIKATIFVGTL
jgi:hypothetical protein